jgi:hypothetical protein
MNDEIDGKRHAEAAGDAEAEEAQRAPVEVVPPSAMDLLIERWFAEHFHGSAVARDTQSWNVVHGAKEALKTLLRAVRLG